MIEFFVDIYDIEDIRNKKFLKEIKIYGESRGDAIDKAHTEAEKLFPNVKRLLEIRQ